MRESNLGSGGMVRVLKQVLNEDIRFGFLLLIPPWYEGRVNQTLAAEEC